MTYTTTWIMGWMLCKSKYKQGRLPVGIEMVNEDHSEGEGVSIGNEKGSRTERRCEGANQVGEVKDEDDEKSQHIYTWTSIFRHQIY